MVGDRPKLRLADAIRNIVFFGLLYLYVWLVVQPQLIYSCGTITNFPVFYKGWPFLRECLSYPGGVLRYVNALLPQFFYYSWAGALVVTAQAWALWACTGWLFRALAVSGWQLWRFIPALLVLVLYARYSYHFPTITGALASLLFACLYVAISSRGANSPAKPALRAKPKGCRCHDVAAYLVLAVVSYMISAAAFLPFALLCAIYEVLYRRRYVMGLACLLVAAVLPYVIGVLVFHASSVNAYTDMLPLSWQLRDWVARRRMLGMLYALCLFPIAVILFWGSGRTVIAWWSSRRIEAQVQPVQKKSGSRACSRPWTTAAAWNKRRSGSVPRAYSCADGNMVP